MARVWNKLTRTHCAGGIAPPWWRAMVSTDQCATSVCTPGVPHSWTSTPNGIVGFTSCCRWWCLKVVRGPAPSPRHTGVPPGGIWSGPDRRRTVLLRSGPLGSWGGRACPPSGGPCRAWALQRTKTAPACHRPSRPSASSALSGRPPTTRSCWGTCTRTEVCGHRSALQGLLHPPLPSRCPQSL